MAGEKEPVTQTFSRLALSFMFEICLPFCSLQTMFDFVPNIKFSSYSVLICFFFTLVQFNAAINSFSALVSHFATLSGCLFERLSVSPVYRGAIFISFLINFISHTRHKMCLLGIFIKKTSSYIV